MSTVLRDLYKIAENAAISSIDQVILRYFATVVVGRVQKAGQHHRRY